MNRDIDQEILFHMTHSIGESAEPEMLRRVVHGCTRTITEIRDACIRLQRGGDISRVRFKDGATGRVVVFFRLTEKGRTKGNEK